MKIYAEKQRIALIRKISDRKTSRNNNKFILSWVRYGSSFFPPSSLRSWDCSGELEIHGRARKMAKGVTSMRDSLGKHQPRSLHPQQSQYSRKNSHQIAWWHGQIRHTTDEGGEATHYQILTHFQLFRPGRERGRLLVRCDHLRLFFFLDGSFATKNSSIEIYLGNHYHYAELLSAPESK